MRRTVFRLTMLILLCSSAFAAEVVDTGALLGEYPVIRWMDNQRVIFLAASGQTCDRKDKPDSYKQPLNRIAIFDTQTRQLSWHGDVGINGLCYADGNIAYARRLVSDGLCPKDEWVYFRGRFGEEKAQQPPSPVNTYTCLPEIEKHASPPWIESDKKSGRLFTPLKPEHGWVEMATYERRAPHANPTYPTRIHTPDGRDLPIDDVFREHIREVGFSIAPPVYVPIKNAYLVVQNYYQNPWPADADPLLMWWLYPTGFVERVKLVNQRNANWGMLIFANNIILLSHVAFDRRRQDESGLYLDASKPIKLVSGFIMDGIAVSPNGCKLAFGVEPRGFWSQGPRQYRLQLIDVCERNSK